jgi:hypothetical protein
LIRKSFSIHLITMIHRIFITGIILLAVNQLPAAVIATILAGDEFALPADSPSSRMDLENRFPFVGALGISLGGSNYRGSAVALSPHWVITAAHNVDLNDDGAADAGWSGRLYLPGNGNYAVTSTYTHPSFTGFANPTIYHDLALLYLASPLPAGMIYPTLGGMAVGDALTLVGFGRSGYGSYGYTSNASLTDRRFGGNVIDSIENGLLFEYDFDSPASTGQLGGSLGNDVETIIGPGDSGGAALRLVHGQWQIVGINTYTDGYGGQFGDLAGGIVLQPYESWIVGITGIPEPSALMMVIASMGLMLRRKKHSEMSV